MEFDAKIFYSKSLINSDSTQIDKYFKKLIKDKKNTENLDRIYFEIGRLKYQKEEYDEALKNYKLSSKENKNKKELLFNTHKNIADIYYDEIYNYRYAKLYYDSAINNINREYSNYDIIKSKSDVLNELVNNLDIIKNNDSLIYLTTIPDSDLNQILERK